MPTATDHYCADLGKEIVELAREAQRRRATCGDEFEKGRQFAFYEVLSLMKQQAAAFGMDDKGIGLEGVNVADFLV